MFFLMLLYLESFNLLMGAFFFQLDNNKKNLLVLCSPAWSKQSVKSNFACLCAYFDEQNQISLSLKPLIFIFLDGQTSC